MPAGGPSWIGLLGDRGVREHGYARTLLLRREKVIPILFSINLHSFLTCFSRYLTSSRPHRATKYNS